MDINEKDQQGNKNGFGIQRWKDGSKFSGIFVNNQACGWGIFIHEDGDTYNDFLLQWMRKHAVNKACTKGRQTKNMCEFKVVRIPFFGEDNEPLDAEGWANGIRKAFREETGIKIVKGQGNTLGRVNFLVGK